MNILIPLRTVNPLNRREHHFARAKRVKAERWATMACLPAILPPLPLVVTFTRVGPKLLDSDGIPGALKGTRDQIAFKLRIDDADPRVRWVYQQELGTQYAVRVTIATHGEVE